MFVEDILGGEGSEDEFSSEALDLVEFFGADKPEVFISFNSDAVEGRLGGGVIGFGQFKGGLDGRHSSAALVVVEIVGGGHNGGQIQRLGSSSVGSVGFAAFEHEELVVVESDGFVLQ